MPIRPTIKKGGYTMQVTITEVNERLSALEAYVGMPKGNTGTTVTARLDAQHRLMLALRADYTDFRAEFNDFRTEVNEFRAETNRRLTSVETRLTAVEDGIGKVLYGITEIKNRLPAN